MIEVIYKEEKQEAQGNEAMFHIPRNIRQIGLVSEDYRIYIEDYVYTFLGRLAGSDKMKENGDGCLAVLTGDTKWSEGTTYLFIRGALMVEDMEAAADHIDFTEEVWTKIHDEQEKYFPEQEIVGWFFSQPQIALEMTEVFTRAHLKHFGGEKVLLLMEPVEREDAFFRYENSFMVRQDGYYIYYEKNPQMQAYMIEKNQEMQPKAAEEVEDEAVKTFRKIIKAKKKEEPEEAEDKPSVFSYAATACLAIAILAVGVNFYHNYQDMQKVNTQAEAVSSVITEKNTENVTPFPTVTPQAASAKTSGTDKTAGEKKEASPAQTENVKEQASSEGSQSNGKDSQESGTDTQAQSQNTQEQQSQEKSAQNQESAAVQDGQNAEGQTADSDDVYQQEADVRKAKRREALAAQEAQSQETSGQNSTSQNGNEGESQNQTASSDEVHESYVIRPGDTLFQISMARYGDMTAIEEICRLNGISEEEIIYPGQVIVLP